MSLHGPRLLQKTNIAFVKFWLTWLVVLLMSVGFCGGGVVVFVCLVWFLIGWLVGFRGCVYVCLFEKVVH